MLSFDYTPWGDQARETALAWRDVQSGEPWRQEEDELLRQYQAKYGNKWSAVATHIPGRTGQQCAQRWRHKVNPNILRDKWAPEEDAVLVAKVHEIGHHWADIARFLPGRTDQQCMGRWRRHLDPAIRKDAWDADDDVELQALYRKYGNSWSRISKCLQNRTPQQCRGRWCILSGYGKSKIDQPAIAAPETPYTMKPRASTRKGKASGLTAPATGGPSNGPTSTGVTALVDVLQPPTVQQPRRLTRASAAGKGKVLLPADGEPAASDEAGPLAGSNRIREQLPSPVAEEAAEEDGDCSDDVWTDSGCDEPSQSQPEDDAAYRPKGYIALGRRRITYKTGNRTTRHTARVNVSFPRRSPRPAYTAAEGQQDSAGGGQPDSCSSSDDDDCEVSSEDEDASEQPGGGAAGELVGHAGSSARLRNAHDAVPSAAGRSRGQEQPAAEDAGAALLAMSTEWVARCTTEDGAAGRAATAALAAAALTAAPFGEAGPSTRAATPPRSRLGARSTLAGEATTMGPRDRVLQNISSPMPLQVASRTPGGVPLLLTGSTATSQDAADVSPGGPWRALGSPPTSALLSLLHAGSLHTPQSTPDKTTPGGADANGGQLFSPNMTTNEWSDVPALSWSEWRNCAHGLGVHGLGVITQLPGTGTPDNMCTSSRPREGMPPRGPNMTPRRDMFIRAGPPRLGGSPGVASLQDADGEGHGATRSLAASPSLPRQASRLGSRVGSRRTSADEHHWAAGGLDAAGLGLVGSSPPRPAAAAGPGQAPDFCSPSKKQKMYPTGGSAAADGSGASSQRTSVRRTSALTMGFPGSCAKVAGLLDNLPIHARAPSADESTLRTMGLGEALTARLQHAQRSASGLQPGLTSVTAGLAPSLPAALLARSLMPPPAARPPQLPDINRSAIASAGFGSLPLNSGERPLDTSFDSDVSMAEAAGSLRERCTEAACAPGQSASTAPCEKLGRVPLFGHTAAGSAPLYQPVAPRPGAFLPQPFLPLNAPAQQLQQRSIATLFPLLWPAGQQHEKENSLLPKLEAALDPACCAAAGRAASTFVALRGI